MKFSTLALAGAIALSVAGVSQAQPAPSPGAPHTDRAHADHHRGWRNADPAKRAEQKAERLRAVLQLRPEQEPALRAFIDASRASPEQMQRRRAERTELRSLTTPQRLDRMQQRMTERQAAFTRRAEATKRFYAQLSPAQQRAFDAMPQGKRGRHGGGGLHHGHGGGGDAKRMG